MRAKKSNSSNLERYKAVSVPVLKEYVASGAVEAVHAVKGSGGVYWLVITVHFSKEPLLLYSQRNHPRAWASLNRLATYIEKMFPRVGAFQVITSERKLL